MFQQTSLSNNKENNKKKIIRKNNKKTLYSFYIPKVLIGYKPKLQIQHQNTSPLKLNFQGRRKGHEELITSLIMKAIFFEIK